MTTECFSELSASCRRRKISEWEIAGHVPSPAKPLDERPPKRCIQRWQCGGCGKKIFESSQIWVQRSCRKNGPVNWCSVLNISLVTFTTQQPMAESPNLVQPVFVCHASEHMWRVCWIEAWAHCPFSCENASINSFNPSQRKIRPSSDQ